MSIPQVLRIEEGLSWADGSTGWVVTLCGGAGWFVGFLQPSLLQKILLNDKVCFAGSGAATGTANLVAGEYEVGGVWKYASGSLHATVFTANCVVQKDGEAQYEKDGTPLVRAFLFYRDEVILHREWNSMGMIATASHSFEVKALKIPVDRCFVIGADHAIMQDAIYRYPFLQLAQTTLTVNLSGMAIKFLDLCSSIFRQKMQPRTAVQSPGPLRLLDAAYAEINQCRLAFYEAAESSWRMCEHGDGLSQTTLDEVTTQSYALAHKALRLTDELYPYCGLTAADPRQEINRVWRNIHTASQHALFTSR